MSTIMKQTAQASMNIKTKKVKKVNKEEALKLSMDLAIKAARLLLTKQKKISTLKITNKKAQGIASNADTESEKLIIDGIKKIYPDHFILAEESAYKEYMGEMNRYKFLKEKEWVWIIDPLDGTNNFLNGLDYYGVCISLAHYGEPVVGLVLRPSNGDCFYAIKGKGTKLINFSNNFKKKTKSLSLKKTTNKKHISDAMFVTGFTTEKGPVFEEEFDLFKSMVGKGRGIRRMGSAALDLCYVARGIFDCFWERGLAAWDVSAAGLICLEAGVLVTDYQGQEFHPFQPTIIASRAPLQKEILFLFRSRL
ncbi:MAG: inositol monophosphatase [Bacteriovorax sp.]|nr:inositol monophosphatase [Bacteriovorax sp.]